MAKTFNPARLVRADGEGNMYLTLDGMLAWFKNDHPGWQIVHAPVSVFAIEVMEEVEYRDDDSSDDSVEIGLEKVRKVFASCDMFIINENGVRVMNAPVSYNVETADFAEKLYQRGCFFVLEMSGYGIENIPQEAWEALREEEIFKKRMPAGTSERRPSVSEASRSEERTEVLRSVQRDPLPDINIDYADTHNNISFTDEKVPDRDFVYPGAKESSVDYEDNGEGSLKRSVMLDLYRKYLGPSKASKFKTEQDLLSNFNAYCRKMVANTWEDLAYDEKREIYDDLMDKIEAKKGEGGN